MKFSCVRATVSLALALCAGTAGAANVDISGFGTAGFIVTDTDKAEFVRGGQFNGADSSGDVNTDSIAGVQATAHFSDRISGTTQVVLRSLHSDTFKLEAGLAFLKADLDKG